MIKKVSKNLTRQNRQKRVRRKVSGTTERPRLNIFRSGKNIYAQIINDLEGKTLVSSSSLDKDLKSKIKVGSNKEAAKLVGQDIAEKAKAKGIETVTFDRAGYLYHGRVKSLADGAREGGLKF